MQVCQVSTFLAYLASIYIGASAIYMLITRQYGTPFRDALNEYPELLKIKMESAGQRRNAFYIGLVVSIVLMIIIRPFGSCF